ncbi:ER lumen protein-retaining receptor B [Vitis vinifera]|uniref:ER lumen protein-retaining receptor B n=1 Tax=Vitis vinifera TaxID=29760 RepID=A0A438E212_VITVI|nr:ER lumen protein-retaining receptor B [Vitis vinifera]
MKLVFLGTSIAIVWYMRYHKVVKQTYSKQEDTFRHYFLVLPCFVLALLIHRSSSVTERLGGGSSLCCEFALWRDFKNLIAVICAVGLVGDLAPSNHSFLLHTTWSFVLVPFTCSLESVKHSELTPFALVWGIWKGRNENCY